jgi:hypothetical protein
LGRSWSKEEESDESAVVAEAGEAAWVGAKQADPFAAGAAAG